MAIAPLLLIKLSLSKREAQELELMETKRLNYKQHDVLNTQSLYNQPVAESTDWCLSPGDQTP